MANYTSEFTGQHNDNYDERITTLLNMVQEQQQTINTLSNQVTTLTTTVNLIQDYIISTNSSGNWFMRTWHSGKKEAFGKFTTNWTPANIWNTGKYLDYGVDFPSGFFTAVPYTIAFPTKNGSSGMPFISSSNLTSTHINFYIWEPNPSQSTNPYSLTIKIYAFQY